MFQEVTLSLKPSVLTNYQVASYSKHLMLNNCRRITSFEQSKEKTINRFNRTRYLDVIELFETECKKFKNEYTIRFKVKLITKQKFLFRLRLFSSYTLIYLIKQQAKSVTVKIK